MALMVSGLTEVVAVILSDLLLECDDNLKAKRDRIERVLLDIPGDVLSLDRHEYLILYTYLRCRYLLVSDALSYVIQSTYKGYSESSYTILSIKRR